MKNILLITVCIFLVVIELHSQDLIVTNDGDSINCTITKISKECIYFTFKHKYEVKNTLLPLDEVMVHKKKYFVTPEIPIRYVFKTKFPRFRVSIDGGWQCRLAKKTKGMDAHWKEHYSKMRFGVHYDIQAGYFFSEFFGIEAMFSQQFFGNKLGLFALTDAAENIIVLGILNEKITFNYAGANYIIRFFNSDYDDCFSFIFGLGYLGYVDKMIINDTEYGKITAATFGINVGLGYDIGKPKNFSIGFKISYMDGLFIKYKQTLAGVTTKEIIPDGAYEGLGTIKLSVGLRLNK
jgi:hypothetical protein